MAVITAVGRAELFRGVAFHLTPVFLKQGAYTKPGQQSKTDATSLGVAPIFVELVLKAEVSANTGGKDTATVPSI